MSESRVIRTTAGIGARHRRRRMDGDRRAAAVMLVGIVLAMVWANAPFATTYEEFWNLPLAISAGGFEATFTLHEVVNEGLMTLFFFLVGLEVKRELTIGELTDRARAVVPITAAVAGLIVPAAIFALFTFSSGHADAWGVVISTDTAFLLGALALIGLQFPARLRIFLLTLAVVDDIGALVAIAIFYNTASSSFRSSPRPCSSDSSRWCASSRRGGRSPTSRSAPRCGRRCSWPACIRRSPGSRSRCSSRSSRPGAPTSSARPSSPRRSASRRIRPMPRPSPGACAIRSRSTSGSMRPGAPTSPTASCRCSRSRTPGCTSNPR